MRQKLLYNIAGFNVAVYVSDVKLAKVILASHAPFELLEGDERLSQPPLYTIYTGVEVENPSDDFLVDSDEMDTVAGYSYLYKNGGDIYIRLEMKEKSHLMKIDTQKMEVYISMDFLEPSEQPYVNVFLIMAFSIATAAHKTLKIHASVIEKDGRALLFLGKSGTGKSTHSRLWLKHVPGATLLNDDAPIVRILEDKSVRVYGAPWSGSTPCYRNISAEVVAFVHLYQSPDNIITRMDGISALSSLMQSSCVIRSDRQNKYNILDTVTDIMQEVPVYRLDCRPDLGALNLTKALLE